MSKLFYKAMIEDIQNDKCTDAELEALLDAFEYTVKKMATTLARKAGHPQILIDLKVSSGT